MLKGVDFSNAQVFRAEPVYSPNAWSYNMKTNSEDHQFLNRGVLLMNLASVAHSEQKNWDFNQRGSSTSQQNTNKDVQRNSQTTSTTTYTPPTAEEIAATKAKYGGLASALGLDINSFFI